MKFSARAVRTNPEAALARRGGRGFDAGGCVREVVYRRLPVGGTVLDRAASETSSGRRVPDRFRRILGPVAVAVLEVAGNRDVDRLDDRAHVCEASSRDSVPSRRPSTAAAAPLDVASA